MRDPELVLITTAQTARILKCVPDNVRKLNRQGKLPAVVTVGNQHQRLYDRRVVEELAATRSSRRGHNGNEAA